LLYQGSAAESGAGGQQSSREDLSERETMELAEQVEKQYPAAEPVLNAAIRQVELGRGYEPLTAALKWAQKRAAEAEAKASSPDDNGETSEMPAPEARVSGMRNGSSRWHFSDPKKDIGPITHHPPQGEPDPRLRELPEETAKFWTDQKYRVNVLRHLASTLEQTTDPKRTQPLLDEIDRHLVAGLRALGYERGPTKGLFALSDADIGETAVASKRPSCVMEVYIAGLNDRIMRQIEDEILVDLIHESIHARAPFDKDHKKEALWRGYEESAVEVRSRELARQAGLTPKEGAYQYWVTALETLAEVLGVPADRLAQ